MNTSESIEKIYHLIKSGGNMEAYEKHYKQLSMIAPFIGITILNEFLYRAGLATYKRF